MLAGVFFLFNVDIKTCEMCADSGPLVLREEERLKLNVEEMVLDPGKETGAGAVQLGVCETSAEDRHILIRWNSFPLAFTPLIWLQAIIGVTHAERKSFLIRNINQRNQCGRSDPCWSVKVCLGCKSASELRVATQLSDGDSERPPCWPYHPGHKQTISTHRSSHLMDDRNFFVFHHRIRISYIKSDYSD